ncbi:MAG: peptide-methionine (S)-S-oxide reductase MsrA [Flavobacteriales bacterium]|jgi:peptide-methionine (S)-S-oxide reductase|nr:peptide-methionine (S)-S-oxide reductase MsrA [Flavobacteriales bacterium]
MKTMTTLLLSIALFTSCGNGNTDSGTAFLPQVIMPQEDQDLSKLNKAYFAEGCFWCAEEVFESVRGVHEVISGYSGGTEKKPTYEDVGSGKTGHAEAIEVYYDPEVVSFETLVNVFFASQDPTTLNRQGPDAGTQYRSIAFYSNKDEKEQIENTIKTLNASGQYDAPIVTQVVPFEKFWPAEKYHQDYVKQNPENPYVQSVSQPRFERFKAKMPEVLK